MSSTRALLKVAGLGVLAVVLFLGSFLVFDLLTEPELDFEPVRVETAIDDWQAPWATATTDSSECRPLAKKWMMIGWDGADWDIILPLLAEGRLPHLASLMENGVYGGLRSFRPSISPAIWTTVATGKSPAEHGIERFYNKRPRLERWWYRLQHWGRLERKLYSNADRRVRALWNILSDRQRKVMVVGYHNTFPVEEVNGLMVSNYLVQDSIGELMQMRSDGGSDSTFALSLVYPQDQLQRILDIQSEVTAAAPQALRPFLTLDDRGYQQFLRQSRTLDREGDQRPYFLMRAFTYDTVVAEIAERLYPEIDPDMFFVHFQGLDWAAHYFLYFHQPELYRDMPWSPEVRQELDAHLVTYRHVVNSFYEYMDTWLGRFLALKDPTTGVILLSDHGFENDDDPQVPGYHDEAPGGLLVMSGPGLRRGQGIEGATVYDILPTLMASMELPVADDRKGRVLQEVFCPEAWETSHQTTVASYETGERYLPEVAKPPELNRDLLDQLESLGYLK